MEGMLLSGGKLSMLLNTVVVGGLGGDGGWVAWALEGEQGGLGVGAWVGSGMGALMVERGSEQASSVSMLVW